MRGRKKKEFGFSAARVLLVLAVVLYAMIATTNELGDYLTSEGRVAFITLEIFTVLYAGMSWFVWFVVSDKSLKGLLSAIMLVLGAFGVIALVLVFFNLDTLVRGAA